MKTNSKEVIELEKVRKKFEEVADKYLKSWTDFEILETYINRNTCKLFIEFKIVGIRMEAVFQLKNYDEDEGRLDWTGMIRPFDLFSMFEDNYDDEDEDEE